MVLSYLIRLLGIKLGLSGRAVCVILTMELADVPLKRITVLFLLATWVAKQDCKALGSFFFQFDGKDKLLDF